MAGAVADGGIISGITVTSATAFPLVNAGGTTSPPGRLVGGTYQVTTVGTFGTSGSIQVQQLGPDGATYVNVGSALSSSGASEIIQVPSGGFRVETSGTITSGFDFGA